jgi:hypothetical protein
MTPIKCLGTLVDKKHKEMTILKRGYYMLKRRYYILMMVEEDLMDDPFFLLSLAVKN